MKKKHSLGKYIGKMLFLITFITILVLMVSSYISTKNLLTERNQLSQQSAANALVKSSNNLKSSTETELQKIAKNKAFTQGSFDYSKIRQILKNTQNGNADIKYIEFASNDGMLITFTKMPSGYNAVKRPWYTGALTKDGSVSWTAPYKDAGTGSVVTTASIKVENYTGQVGVVEMDLSYKSMTDVFSAMKIGRTGSVTLVHKDGTVVVSNGKSKDYTFKQGKSIKNNVIFKKITAAKKTKGTLTIDGVGKVYYNKDSNDSADWSFAVVDSNDLSSELHSLIKISIIVTLVMILVVLLYAAYISKVISKTVAVYIKYFENAGKGKFAKIKPAKNKSVLKAMHNTQQVGEILSSPKKDGHEFNKIAYHYNTMVDSIQGTISKVQDASQGVATRSDSLLNLSEQTNKATEEVAQAITGIAEVTTSQAQETADSVTQLKDLSDIIKEMRQNVEQMTEQSENSGKLNQQNLSISDEVSANWSQELDKMEQLMNNMSNLNEQVQDISKIVNIINGISQQTNLLALNASIEAASAGEAGKGFSVVATEIRKLSDQSRDSTKRISEIIDKIQVDSKEMVTMTSDSVSGGKKQSELIGQAISSSKDVFAVNQKLIQDIEKIEHESQKIEDVQNKVLESLENISASTEENSAGTQEVSANSEEVQATMEEFTGHVAELQKTAVSLEQVVKSFKIEKN
ncbi:methyl-accepting chemotaxis protein [Ligilactobacillus sp. WILCCON 0076]|uniref:Methyl-accepting chemotaxis protein n=1 Tax=Ligilactobacillus ubinensis TaxID=2876789 RepID=A0A9X2JMM7_9LACO|nr:methyl-accepting chemotaxis protein [Ligilactobacillus ubinensis]MCP0887999.1 methyl-accepting chemotaxis protein [Ligilactobacillus ubinensis]